MTQEIYHEGRLDDRLLADYRASRKAYLEGDVLRADQLYSANRRHHACDIYFEVALPDLCRLIHPIGTVIARGTYGAGLVVYDNCTIGGSINTGYPVLGSGVCVQSGARILGDSVIGNNVWIGPNVVVMNQIIPDDTEVFMSTDPIFGRLTADWSTTDRSVISHFWPEHA